MKKIQTEKEAMEAVQSICEWLASQPEEKDRDWMSDGRAKIARSMCDKILEAAKAEATGGCPLCMS